jgi:hypothetical protein
VYLILHSCLFIPFYGAIIPINKNPLDDLLELREHDLCVPYQHIEPDFNLLGKGPITRVIRETHPGVAQNIVGEVRLT